MRAPHPIFFALALAHPLTYVRNSCGNTATAQNSPSTSTRPISLLEESAPEISGIEFMPRNQNVKGDFFYTDNQGLWNASSSLKHLKLGGFMGNPSASTAFAETAKSPTKSKKCAPPAIASPSASKYAAS